MAYHYRHRPRCITGLLGTFDWHDIYKLYAFMQIIVCVPPHLLLLPGRKHIITGAGPVTGTAADAAYLEGEVRTSAFVLLALAFTLQGFVMSAVSVHMLTLMQGLGLSAAVAVGIGAMVGPWQVGGRLVVKAAAPLAFAMLVERAGLMPGVAILAGLSGLAALALFILSRRPR